VPIGPNIDGRNLHGLATATGGTVVRAAISDSAASVCARLAEDVRGPVLYPSTVNWSATTKDVYPTQLPPLRSDVPTLVLGRLSDATTRKLACNLTGTVAGRQVAVSQSEAVLPHAADCFFLSMMERRWRTAKDMPALVRADWTLRLAADEMEVAHDQ